MLSCYVELDIKTFINHMTRMLPDKFWFRARSPISETAVTIDASMPIGVKQGVGYHGEPFCKFLIL